MKVGVGIKKEDDMKLIPDFASMPEDKLFQFLKFGVARLFLLCIVGLGVAKAFHPLWLELAALVLVLFLVSHPAISTGRGILFLEQKSTKQKD